MSRRDLPLLGNLSQVGPHDPVFDLFLLVGPVLIASVAILGRGVITLTSAALYVALFALYVAYRGFRSRP